MSDCLVREVRLVDVEPGGSTRRRRPSAGEADDGEALFVDLRIQGGAVAEVGPGLRRRTGETVHEGGGRWAIPGLWDAHVHLGQWAATSTRLDVSSARDVGEVQAIVGAELAALPGDARDTICGFGYRTATWTQQPTVAALDALTDAVPVVLVSGDCHSGWLNTPALQLLGLPVREGVVAEKEWFDAFPLLEERLPGLRARAFTGYRTVVADAARRGVTGIVDLEFERGVDLWPDRFSRGGIDALRIRIGTYADGLDDVLHAGLRTGDPVGDGGGLLTMGPLKIISDGSLNTRTAHCCEPYADASTLEHPCGMRNLAVDDLRQLLEVARGRGLEVALHAIGDAAVRDALDVFQSTGARGSIEHAQLMRRADIPRLARLGVTASVQPAHLWDDRDVATHCWPDRADRCFPFRSILEAGGRLALGSDAPVSPLDPWLAMAAAVHRSADDREPWFADESLTVAEALACSLDGQGTLRVGSRGDVVLLDTDPLAMPDDTAEAAAVLREMPVAATILAGRLTHG
ncbi:amidohydrolase [Mobilicoccus pelagius]|uniref:Putative hydrolase n=1 Tax=Mobilicoccus pelagius NBRC 104925 TaxID=1089455 RepID=H5UNP9_9MICO|nr:amidohydrolase family protein [Mobilicoccus pelagius]GAB47357.1 putative hydrolase [Mobilicoccus pelagius NBRC 104925]